MHQKVLNVKELEGKIIWGFVIPWEGCYTLLLHLTNPWQPWGALEGLTSASVTGFMGWKIAQRSQSWHHNTFPIINALQWQGPHNVRFIRQVKAWEGCCTPFIYYTCNGPLTLLDLGSNGRGLYSASARHFWGKSGCLYPHVNINNICQILFPVRNRASINRTQRPDHYQILPTHTNAMDLWQLNSNR